MLYLAFEWILLLRYGIELMINSSDTGMSAHLVQSMIFNKYIYVIDN